MFAYSYSFLLLLVFWVLSYYLYNVHFQNIIIIQDGDGSFSYLADSILSLNGEAQLNAL